MDLHAAAPARRDAPRGARRPDALPRVPGHRGRAAGRDRARNPGDQVAITWREYAQRVEAIAAGLARLGVERGDSVALMLLNRPEFHLVDTAVLHLGATPFSVYNTSTPGGSPLVPNSGCKLVRDRAPLPPTVQARPPPRAQGRPPRPASTAPTTTSSASTSWRAPARELPVPGDLGGGHSPPTRRDHLHLRHHRPAQGRRAHPRQRDGRVRRAERFRSPPAAARCPTSERPRGRPLEQPLVVVADVRLQRHRGRRPADGDLPTPSVRPTRWGAVPRIWEKLSYAALSARGSATPRSCPRTSAPPCANGWGSTRPSTSRRRGADADRRAPLLRGPGPAHQRGLGHVRDRRRRHRRPARLDPARYLRDAAARRRGPARRRRRAARPRPDGDARYRETPARPRRRSPPMAGCAPATSPTSRTATSRSSIARRS